MTPTGCRVPIEDRLQHGSTVHLGQSGGTRPLESDVNVSGRDLRKMPVKTGWRLLVRADFFRHSPPDSRSGTEPPKTDPTRIRQLWFRIGPYPRRILEARVGIGLCFPMKNINKMPCFLQHSRAIWLTCHRQGHRPTTRITGPAAPPFGRNHGPTAHLALPHRHGLQKNLVLKFPPWMMLNNSSGIVQQTTTSRQPRPSPAPRPLRLRLPLVPLAPDSGSAAAPLLPPPALP